MFVCTRIYSCIFCIRPHSIAFWLHYTINGEPRQAPHLLTNIGLLVKCHGLPCGQSLAMEHTDTHLLSAGHTMDGFGRLGIRKDSEVRTFQPVWT